MSALGQKRTFALQTGMSALHLIATVKADIALRTHAPQGDTDLPPHRKSARRPAFAWSHQDSSTVRYLGIDVDDAIAIAEQVDV